MVSDDPLQSDALTTGIFVLGEVAGANLAESIPGIGVLMVTKDKKLILKGERSDFFVGYHYLGGIALATIFLTHPLRLYHIWLVLQIAVEFSLRLKTKTRKYLLRVLVWALFLVSA